MGLTSQTILSAEEKTPLIGTVTQYLSKEFYLPRRVRLLVNDAHVSALSAGQPVALHDVAHHDGGGTHVQNRVRSQRAQPHDTRCYNTDTLTLNTDYTLAPATLSYIYVFKVLVEQPQRQNQCEKNFDKVLFY